MIAAAHQWVSTKHYMKVEEKEKKDKDKWDIEDPSPKLSGHQLSPDPEVTSLTDPTHYLIFIVHILGLITFATNGTVWSCSAKRREVHWAGRYFDLASHIVITDSRWPLSRTAQTIIIKELWNKVLCNHVALRMFQGHGPGDAPCSDTWFKWMVHAGGGD